MNAVIVACSVQKVLAIDELRCYKSILLVLFSLVICIE